MLKPGENLSSDPLNSAANIGRDAVVTVSSTHPDYNGGAAVDGAVDGYPGNIRREWASNGERNTAMIRLTWPTARKINRVWLFDRPNDLDQVVSGMLVFSDGSTLGTGELPDNGKKGLEVGFEPKTVSWVAFLVNTTKPSTLNIGLSEIAVFTAP